MIIFHDVEQGSEEWKVLRAPLYTGAGADKLLSYSGHVKIVDGVVSPYAIAEITGFAGNFYTKRGHILEDEAIELYEQIKGVAVRKVGFVTNTLYPTCGYSPDGLPLDRTLECKAFSIEKHLKMIAGNIPLKVLAQCHFGMLICGKKLCDLILYNPDLAKKQLKDKDGNMYDNPYYDPKKAWVVIPIRWNPAIASNFKRILRPSEVTVNG